MNKWFGLGLFVVACVAIGLRCPRLGERPMHNDEAVNAVKFGELWQHGAYRYDPHEYHGPALAYATLAIEKATGAPDFDHFTEARLRLIALVFGVGLILLLPLLGDGLGLPGVLWASVLTACSPAMVFYSRYYIHEMLLAFFTLLAMGAGWRYSRSRKIGWALLAGAGLGLMHATKETFVITLAAAGLALAVSYAWNRWVDASVPAIKAPRIPAWHLAAACGVWLTVALMLFSSFLANPGGPLDSIRTYLPWLGRAGGDSPHIQPWSFYLHRLLFFHDAPGPIWSEAFIFVLGIIGALSNFGPRRPTGAHAAFVRFLTLYTFGLMAAYSFIAYKTPWCLLSFWQGMILLAGVGAAAVSRAATRPAARMILLALLVTGSSLLGVEAWLAAVPYAADRRNPYVYGHTSPDVLNLVQKVAALADAHPQGQAMRLNVITADGDYWPLPWYLRQLKQAAWYSAMPADPWAPVMVVSASLRAGLDDKKTHLMVGIFQLRPGVFLELYVELELWRAYLAKHPPEPE